MSQRRSIATSAALGALVLVVSGCADGEVGSPTAATITILPQSYQTRPGPTQVGQTTVAAVTDDGRAQQGQDYVLQDGDYPSTVAVDFGISLDDLLAYNEWDLVGQIVPEWPAVGETVKIPPGALVPTDDAAAGSSTTVVGNTVNSQPGSATSTSLGDECTPGSYTIEAGDYPIDVAGNFDVSVDALNAANAATTGYSAFYPGLEIVIPPAEGC